MNKKAQLPNRQTFVNPAGMGTKSEVFGIFVSDIYLLAVMLNLDYENIHRSFKNCSDIDFDFVSV
jgi:hypothetical protein